MCSYRSHHCGRRGCSSARVWGGQTAPSPRKRWSGFDQLLDAAFERDDESLDDLREKRAAWKLEVDALFLRRAPCPRPRDENVNGSNHIWNFTPDVRRGCTCAHCDP